MEIAGNFCGNYRVTATMEISPRAIDECGRAKRPRPDRERVGSALFVLFEPESDRQKRRDVRKFINST